MNIEKLIESQRKFINTINSSYKKELLTKCMIDRLQRVSEVTDYQLSSYLDRLDSSGIDELINMSTSIIDSYESSNKNYIELYSIIKKSLDKI